jgi:hypothetical protein
MLFCIFFSFSHLTNWPDCGTVGLRAHEIVVKVRRWELDFAILPNPRLNLHFFDFSAVKYVVLPSNGPWRIQFSV